MPMNHKYVKKRLRKVEKETDIVSLLKTSNIFLFFSLVGYSILHLQRFSSQVSNSNRTTIRIS